MKKALQEVDRDLVKIKLLLREAKQRANARKPISQTMVLEMAAHVAHARAVIAGIGEPELQLD